VYVKAVTQSQVSAMDALGDQFKTENLQRPGDKRLIENGKLFKGRKMMEPRGGLEPPTCRLRIGCSTN
jgi:hypothetical protein